MNAVILCAGDPPSESLLKERCKNADIIIAADGGIDCLEKYKILPDYIIGDFDSADKTAVEKNIARGISYRKLHTHKDETDSKEAITYAIEKGAKNITLLGGLGGRIDHSIANLMLLKYVAINGAKMTVEDDSCACFAASGEYIIEGDIDGEVSLFPLFGRVTVNAPRGLYYPLNNLTLKEYDPIGISNVFTANTVKMNIEGYVLIIKNK